MGSKGNSGIERKKWDRKEKVGSKGKSGIEGKQRDRREIVEPTQ